MIKCTFLNKDFYIAGKETYCTLKARIPIPTIVSKNTLRWVKHHQNYISIVNYNYNNSPFPQKRLIMNFVGQATRSDNDKPDEVLGKRLAESRAKRRAYRFCEKLCGYIIKDLEMIANYHADAEYHFNIYFNKEEKHLETLLKEDGNGSN